MNLILHISKSRHAWTLAVLSAIILLSGWMGISPRSNPPAPGGLVPPANAKPLCTVPPPTFASWFDSGFVSLNGSVKPANSITFPNSPNCSFYQWSYQMFLWLNSPTPPSYGGGGGRIFDSPVFYDVTPPDSLGNRQFIPHSAGFISSLAIRTAQVGPHGLQVVMSSAGPMFELVDPVFSERGLQMILNGSGQQVEIGKSTLVQGKPTFFDVSGALIENPRPIIPQQLLKVNVVQAFPIDNIAHFLGVSGSEVVVEQGQAGGNSVLRSRNGSLVYYATFVNDVFAWFLTGAKTGLITPRPVHFPTTQTELDKAIAVGKPHGISFVDSVALAIEVKTSWVEASTVTDPGNYIIIKATIPTYDTTNPANWVVNGQKTVPLAMVGMHVVGSTFGHPEMIWATFEHFENTPADTYSYINTSNATVTVPQNTAGNWLFCDPSSAGPFNVEHMFYSANHIIADPGFNVTYSNTLHRKAWGAAFDQSPNPIDASAAVSNTEIISINNSVRNQLITGDVRANYIMGGATWTENGLIPTSSFPSGNVVGTSKMCNSTMETYQQGANNLFATGISCFDCHQSTSEPDNLADTFVSHIYGALQPLPLTPGPHLGPGTPPSSTQSLSFKVPEKIKVFPNPTADMLNLEVVVHASGGARLVIGDLSGKIRTQQTTWLQTGTNFVSIPVGQLNPGNYFIKLYKDDGSTPLTSAFLKQ